MGIYALMAVALKKGAQVSEINQRFRETHSRDHTCVEDMDLILDLAPRGLDEVEYVNLYTVSTNEAHYYGARHERGPCLKLMLQLEWLRAQPEVEAVYYGTDCADSPRPWKESESMDLVKHFFKNGHTPYARWAAATWKAKP